MLLRQHGRKRGENCQCAFSFLHSKIENTGLLNFFIVFGMLIMKLTAPPAGRVEQASRTRGKEIAFASVDFHNLSFVMQNLPTKYSEAFLTPEWLTAISTIVLALVAVISIFRDEIRKWLFQPKFDLLFQLGQPDCHLVPLDWWTDVSRGRAPTHYIRCRVKNVGKLAAQDIEVAVVEVRKKDATGNFCRLSMATPWNLMWAHFNTHVLRQLPRDAERHITLGHIIEPSQRRFIQGEDDPDGDPSKTLFCLEVFVRSNTLEYLLEPGEYEIDLQVSAANAKPRVFTFYINHTGHWFQDENNMYAQGLGLRMISG
jgi:hypothetical protein